MKQDKNDLKNRLYKIIFESSTRAGLLFDLALIVVILLSVLMSDVSIADSFRYMPRYFYNLLMTKVGESNEHSLNAMQIAIDKAYSDRGLHFTPQVISAGIPNPQEGKDKNLFRIGDPVHVKVSNCPQNTPLTVYIVEDQDYTDGMNISALNNVVYQISGTSDNEGVWYSITPVMTASIVGDYDILVDIGNNGVLHFAYYGANVRDGFDGLDGSGFTVFDDRIDIAISLDQSGSMNNSAPHIHKTASQFLSCLNPGDRVNVFGFHNISEVNPNIDNHVGTSTSMVQIPTNTTFTVYTFGYTNLRLPFLYGYQRFPTSQRKKGLVLLSDGEHNADLYDPAMTFNSVMGLIRNSPLSKETVVSAFYCFLRFRPEEGLIAAASGGGDTDSIASIAGNLFGAAYGASWIPQRWLVEIEQRERIEGIAKELFHLCESYCPQ